MISHYLTGPIGLASLRKEVLDLSATYNPLIGSWSLGVPTKI